MSLAASILTGCGSETPRPLELRVVRSVVLDSLPAGSAMNVVDGRIVFISDNAPAYYRLSLSLDPASLERIPMQRPDSDLYELPKPMKPDFEASLVLPMNAGDLLIAFGSGSLSPGRDSLLVLPLTGSGHEQILPAGQLYKHLRQSCGIAPKDFNIEAAAKLGDRIYLANRGTNSVFVLKAADFLLWLKASANAPLPSVQEFRFELPKLGDRTTGISGMAEAGDNRLLFCASAEATDNWYSDGAVLGSVIGIVEIDGDGRPALSGTVVLMDSNGKAMPQKLESLVVMEASGKDFWRVLAVADNDNGSSTLFELEVCLGRGN